MFRRQSPEEQEERKARLSREVLLGIAPGMRTGRRLFSNIPADPRCKLCASPFRGPVAPLLGLIGKKPFPGNPKYCTFCFNRMIEKRAGAEVPCSVLFADVRGSTTLAEQLPPAEFRAAMDGFFGVASRVLVSHEAFVDKFVGDEVMAFFIPALAGEQHARRAIEAGRDLLAAVAELPRPLPVGIGVNTGIAFVGTVGTDAKAEFTAMGDPVNVGARLASAAGAGELLVTVAAIRDAGMSQDGMELRTLELKGKTEATQVAVLRD